MGKTIDTLLKGLSEADALPFLFVGSGFSRRYLNLMDWKELVTHFAKQAIPAQESRDFAYQLYKNKIENVSDEKILPAITELVERDYITRFLLEPEFINLREKYGEEIAADISPFKIGVADYFAHKADLFDSPEFNNEITALKAITDKVAGIITTNFDTFIEYLFPDFQPFVGQDELLFSHLNEVAEVYKIHGCCTKPDSMVLSSKDYEKFNEKNAYLSAKLLTIFIEHPVIFIGYSLNDSNIRDIMTSIVTCLNPEQLQTLSNRFFFVERAKDTRPAGVRPRDIEFNGIPFTIVQVVVEDFSDVYSTVAQLSAKYPPKVLRKLKQDIYELVRTNDPRGKLHVLNIDDVDKMDQVQ